MRKQGKAAGPRGTTADSCKSSRWPRRCEESMGLSRADETERIERERQIPRMGKGRSAGDDGWSGGQRPVLCGRRLVRRCGACTARTTAGPGGQQPVLQGPPAKKAGIGCGPRNAAGPRRTRLIPAGQRTGHACDAVQVGWGKWGSVLDSILLMCLYVWDASGRLTPGLLSKNRPGPRHHSDEEPPDEDEACEEVSWFLGTCGLGGKQCLHLAS